MHSMTAPTSTPSRHAGRWSRTAHRHPYGRHEAALHQFGDTMIADAQAAGRPLTVVVFEQADLPELHVLFGSEAARTVTAKFNQQLQALAGSRGLAMRSDATTWTVLMPGLDHAQAKSEVERVFGPSLAVDVESEGEEILLVPTMEVRTVVRGAAPMRRIYQEMRGRIAGTLQRQQRREEVLRAERERHSRPAPLTWAATAPARAVQ
ncbi:MAG TPA: hypothetical protein VF522_03555 [Ramlibacter sp.]|uniref:hypothetical protein n=1 Tax=Ramlibacter sp. TaxID=1917967 RepID=UPI002ED14480